MLDAASGLGYGGSILAHTAPGIRVIGVDSSANAINYARDHFGPQFPNLEFREGDVCRLPKGSRMNRPRWWCHSRPSSISKRPRIFWLEVRRALKPERGVHRLGAQHVGKMNMESDPNPWHFHRFDLAKLRRALCQRLLSLESTCIGSALGCGMKLTPGPAPIAAA